MVNSGTDSVHEITRKDTEGRERHENAHSSLFVAFFVTFRVASWIIFYAAESIALTSNPVFLNGRRADYRGAGGGSPAAFEFSGPP